MKFYLHNYVMSRIAKFTVGAMINYKLDFEDEEQLRRIDQAVLSADGEYRIPEFTPLLEKVTH